MSDKKAKKSQRSKHVESGFQTYPLFQTGKKISDTNVNIPSQENTEAAKNWVDKNQK